MSTAVPARSASEDRQWWTLAAVAIAIFMLLLDITIVNVALPKIQSSLHASFSDLQWVVDAYALTLASVLLVSGSIADLIGRRRVFSLGLVLFSLASLLCGLAGSPIVLTLSRAVQGIGGAMMFATSLALIAQAFRGAERATAFGVIGAVTGAAVAVGPLVGGALTDAFGWQSIFLVNIPIGVGALAVTLVKVAESRDPTSAGIDWLGAAIFSGALFLLVFGLIRGNESGWGSTQIVSMLAGAAMLLVAFLLVEMRREHPMLDLTLFRKPTFTGANSTAFILSATMFAMFLYLTLYLQNVLAYTPLQTGLRFLPITLLAFFAGPIAGRLSVRVPTRVFLAGGLLLVSLGLLLMGGLDDNAGWNALLPGFLIAGLGIGMINPPLASTAIGVVPPQRSGMGSGINSTFRQVGIATGIAGLGAIFQSHVQGSLQQAFAHTPLAAQAHAIARAVASGGAKQVIGSFPPALRGAVGHAARHAFVTGLNELFVITGIVALVGALLAAVLVRQRDFVQTGAPPAAAA